MFFAFIPMFNQLDIPAIDLVDYGDHSGMQSLIEEAGLPLEDNEYYFSNEPFEFPEMEIIA